ncbi:hypothetical protein HBH53_258280 [Parastagonospora nodorum]|nr:hypothetical protein HBH53_258280 [Parastagonospora nodorum]
MSTPLSEGSSDNPYHRIPDALEKIADVLGTMFDTVNNLADTMNKISSTLLKLEEGRVRDRGILVETLKNHGTQNQSLPRHVENESAHQRSVVNLKGGPEIPPPRPFAPNWVAESCASTKVSRESPTLLSSPTSYESLSEISTPTSPESSNKHEVKRLKTNGCAPSFFHYG